MKEMEHQVRQVSEYVEMETHDEQVEHAERLLTTKVLSRAYEVWDVRTNKERYWVVTNPTNLYSQDEFKSADYVLTFHIGLGLRIAERGRTERDEDQEDHVGIAWRKYEQGVDAYNSADEAEAYQAVGVRCREALIALARRVAAAVPTELVADPAPKASNFKAWSETAAEHLATGRLRSYLKAIADKTWDLAVWLQHYEDATPWDAELVLDATQHTIATFGMAFVRHEKGQPDRCPRCDSYRVESDGGMASDEPYIQWLEKVCGACEHRWDHEFIRWVDNTGWTKIDAPPTGAIAPAVETSDTASQTDVRKRDQG